MVLDRFNSSLTLVSTFLLQGMTRFSKLGSASHKIKSRTVIPTVKSHDPNKKYRFFHLTSQFKKCCSKMRFPRLQNTSHNRLNNYTKNS